QNKDKVVFGPSLLCKLIIEIKHKIIESIFSNNIFEKESIPIRILAFLEAKEGKKRELLNILIPISEYSRKEEGNIKYILNLALYNPNYIMIDEAWSSKEAFDKHYNSHQSVENRNKVKSLLVKPMEIKIFKELK
ncbi:MAG: putative quinol monooxygenase, partial [Candidatus Nitrosocosmicus sp.]